ncbi:hypothetical protein [Saccharopolyspora phatthalungensis]|uniref:Uncharacterized protein n=1 Tax=Saccharopolyspora phatthalungensis TaxID=664693 RepID=A0A840QDM0_9PSEU|nr:hypothetical protein [Saccharopolyspora phatthalungensis]MBB5158506.1 hypothetical protein [Saccharopolyspora phatthalungensis]
MGSPWRHPIEGVYAAREALDDAATVQARGDLTREDWPAYGSALIGVLTSLDHLTRTLVERIDEVDRDLLFQQALRDHPHEALDRAVEHLRHLRRVLASALTDAQDYWSEAKHVHDDTAHGPE